MTKETQKPTSNNSQLANPPLIFADSLVGLAIGPFVSKIILGVENPEQKHIPSIQVTMPTNALHSLAKHITEALRDADVQKNLTNGYQGFQESWTE
jgi:hypothetical protein